MDFGNIPLDIVPNEDGTYSVSSEHVAKADECGISATFSADRLSIMEARATAYGYVFAYPVSEETVQQVELPPSKLFKVPSRPKQIGG